jgi:hypothetical protein
MDKGKAGSMCICSGCPTYFDCGEPLAFCFYEKGASGCITVNRGCICPGCPVYSEAGLQFDSYCISGSETAQKG